LIHILQFMGVLLLLPVIPYIVHVAVRRAMMPHTLPFGNPLETHWCWMCPVHQEPSPTGHAPVLSISPAGCGTAPTGWR